MIIVSTKCEYTTMRMVYVAADMAWAATRQREPCA